MTTCYVRVYANALFFVLYDGGESEVNILGESGGSRKCPPRVM